MYFIVKHLKVKCTFRKDVAMDEKYLKTSKGLTKDITDSTCCFTLEQNINKYIENVAGCKRCFVLWPLGVTGEAVIHAIGNSILPENNRFFVLSPTTITSLTTEDTEIDGNFIQYITPLLEEDGVSNSFVINKILVYHPDEKDRIAFTYILVECPKFQEQKKYIEDLLREYRSVIISAFQLQQERTRKEQCQALLSIAKNLFLHLGDLGDLMQEIILEARKLTSAERCSLFLVSEDGNELVAKVFDGVPREQAEEVRMPITQGIAGHVATTGETLNIKDAYHHPLFYKKLDEITGFTTRNILCFPIRDGQNRVVGVAQLCNKQYGFTTLDEEASAALATYCGISLMHSLVYKKIQQSQARSRLANEVLMYHLAVGEDSVSTVTHCTHTHDFPAMLDWSWHCRDAAPNATPCLILHMFESLGFLASCRMERSTVARFILLVKKGYRDIPYHNWMHAFSAAHFTFCVMKQLDLIEKSWITELEGVALLVAALCHDLDHRGTTNSFQTKSKNILACLYSSEGSVMERHHFAQALCILNTEGCNIFENLDTAAYRRVLDLMRDLILATDLATHLSHLSKVSAIAESYCPEQNDHRSHLLALLMTSADLSDQVKGWAYTRHIANLIYDEFFAQGDLERAMGTEPAIMMDRERAEIPTLQVQFLTEICQPCYKILAKFFPPLEPCAGAVEDSLRKWKLAKKWFDLPEQGGKSALELLNDTGLEAYVNDEDNVLQG